MQIPMAYQLLSLAESYSDASQLFRLCSHAEFETYADGFRKINH